MVRIFKTKWRGEGDAHADMRPPPVAEEAGGEVAKAGSAGRTLS